MSTACFYPLDTAESLKLAGELGFRKVELFINSDSEMGKPYISLIRKICRHYGITVVSVHFFTASFESMMFFSAYGRRTRDSIDRYRRYFEALGGLSPSFLTFHGERSTVSGLSFDRPAFPVIVEAYQGLCDAAKPYGLVISQENVAWCRSKSPEYVEMLRESLPQLCFTLDIKQAIRAGSSPESYVEAMGDALRNIHICDYNDRDTCLLPGKGDMNYYKFFELIKQKKYKNDIIIEIYSSNYVKLNDIIESGKFLQEIINCQI